MTKQQDRAAVGYIRCSTVGQVRDGETLERQEALLRAYFDQHGHRDVTIIRDEGRSGFKDSRPGFQRLVKMCRADQVSVVAVTDLSRLSRRASSALTFIEDVIQRHDIELVALQNDIDTSTPMGRAFLGLIAVFNQLYRDEVAYKTRIALAFKRGKGEKLGGITPFGVDVVAGRLVVNAVEAEALRLIGQLHGAGLSIRKIASILTERGTATKTGAPWSAKVVWSLVRRVQVLHTHGEANGADAVATDGRNGNRVLEQVGQGVGAGDQPGGSDGVG